MEESRLTSRRGAFVSAAGLIAGSALALPGCSKKEEGEDVSATEDLMREHGVLRRILVVYRETAVMLRGAPDRLDIGAVAAAADLFKTFGEDYHEAKLEEQHIFPALRKVGGDAGALVDILLAQHQRGRDITTFIKARSATGKLATGDAEPLAKALEAFARMYEAHTAYEDTIAFQAWKKSLSKKQMREASDQFEDIEHDQFKGDGFDMAVDQIVKIEQRLGVHDLARFTAAAP